MKKKFVIGATAAILIVAVVAIIISISASPSLVLKNKDTGKVYMKIPINDGEESVRARFIWYVQSIMISEQVFRLNYTAIKRFLSEKMEK